MARNTNGTGFSLKDELFNQTKVHYLASLFKATDPHFKAVQFEKMVMKDLLNLELKERIVHIATHLEDFLATDFETLSEQILNALPEPLDPAKTDDDFGDFIFAPLGELIVRNGLQKKYVAKSLLTIKELTKRFSMEFAVRYFINEFPKETMKELTVWSTDDNYHVRRLVSEGTRALLPWAGRLHSISYQDPLPFLTTLHTDKTRYVTRSVANHMNDIAKKDPKLVVDTLKEWQQLSVQDPKELDWMISHSLRTLIKQGDRGALVVLGFNPNPKIVVSEIALESKTVSPGEALEFSFTITAEKDERLVIDYVVDFVKASGSTAPKVFKLKQVAIKKGETIQINKCHPFRKNTTTFTFYSGTHSVTLQINGVQHTSSVFELKV